MIFLILYLLVGTALGSVAFAEARDDGLTLLQASIVSVIVGITWTLALTIATVALLSGHADDDT